MPRLALSFRVWSEMGRSVDQVKLGCWQLWLHKQLPANIPHKSFFKPSYTPREQRLCLCPDGDFYKSLRHGKANVVTVHVKTVTEHRILLESGQGIGYRCRYPKVFLEEMKIPLDPV